MDRVGALRVKNQSHVSHARVLQVTRALKHWAPYQRVLVEIHTAPMLYRARAWLYERRIEVWLGPSSDLPYVDRWIPKVSWGCVRSMIEAYVGLLAHELWHLRQHRARQKLSEREADEAARHAIRAWKAGHRTRIALPT